MVEYIFLLLASPKGDCVGIAIPAVSLILHRVLSYPGTAGLEGDCILFFPSLQGVYNFA